MNVRFKQYTFQISTPFQAGHRLSQAEAQVLNRVRAENIRNCLSRALDEMLGVLAPGQLLTEQQMDKFQSKITQFDASYKFLERPEPKAKSGTLEAEALRVAVEQAEITARREGRQQSLLALADEAAALLGKPAVQAEARRRLAERAKIAASALEDLL